MSRLILMCCRHDNSACHLLKLTIASCGSSSSQPVFATQAFWNRSFNGNKAGQRNPIGSNTLLKYDKIPRFVTLSSFISSTGISHNNVSSTLFQTKPSTLLVHSSLFTLNGTLPRNGTTRRRRFGAANSAQPIQHRQLGDGTIRRRANSTRAIRRRDISARRL